MATRGLAASRRTTFVIALLLVLPLACGSGGSRGTDAGTELFTGPVDALVPHDTGRNARFRVTAHQGSSSDVSSFTSTVTANAGDGGFTTRYVSAIGAVAESTSRDSGDAIEVLRFVSDPGGPDQNVATPDPPVTVVRTPVVAGDAIETGFVRTLELEIRVGSATERRAVLFTGTARRVPEERGPATVADGTYGDAIRYAVQANGEATIDIVGKRVTLRVDVAGDEWFAIGVGGVKEQLEVTVRAGDGRAAITFLTEREGAPPDA